MRILSQDKTISLNFDDIDLKINDTNICTTKGEKKIVLGIYASRERAREVFTEIHKIYIGLPDIQGTIEENTIKENVENWSKNTMVAMVSTPAKANIIGNIVYMMPTE